MTQQRPHYFFVVPRDAALLQIWSTAPREPKDASGAHISHAVETRMSPCRCRAGRSCELVVHSAKHRPPVLEPHHIPLKHTGRTLLILGCVIFVEERVPETLLFGVPSCTLTRRARLRALPTTPFNARFDGFAHGSPPLRDRNAGSQSASSPADWISQGLYLSRVTSQKGCQGINTACPVPGVLAVPISCRGLMARPRDDDRTLEKGRVEEYVGLRIQPRHPIRLDRIGERGSGRDRYGTRSSTRTE